MWKKDPLDALTRLVADSGYEPTHKLVKDLVAKNDPTLAMWIARLADGLGFDWAEKATDEILSHPSVMRMLYELRKTPWRKDEIVPKSAGFIIAQNVAEGSSSKP